TTRPVKSDCIICSLHCPRSRAQAGAATRHSSRPPFPRLAFVVVGTLARVVSAPAVAGAGEVAARASPSLRTVAHEVLEGLAVQQELGNAPNLPLRRLEMSGH